MERRTFAEFQATGVEVLDLGTAVDDCSLFDKPGRLYTCGLYLEPFATNPALPWCITIGNFSEAGTLEQCEADLYHYYLAEACDDDVRAYLRDIAPANRWWLPETDDEETLCKLLAAFCKFHGLPPRSADELLATEGLTAEQCGWLTDFILRWDAVMETADAMARSEVARLQPRVPAIPTPSHGPAFPQLDELLAAARPLAKSLTRRITADNAMTPQAVMVRRLNAALAAFPE